MLASITFSVNAQIITNGLVGYYPFNGNANDESGNSNNGTVMNGATLTNDRFGNPNTAYLFDGIDDYISIPPSAFINTEFTFSGWVNASLLPNGTLHDFFGIGDNVSADQAFGLADDQFGSGFFYAGYRVGGSPSRLFQDTFPKINQWYHYVVTSSLSSMNLYINGLLIKSASTLGLAPDYGTGTGAFIGTRFAGFQSWTGMVDDIYIFNRALSASEVLALYYDCNNSSTCKNLITGYIYNDLNGNCSNDTTDLPIPNRLVKIEPGPVYGISDSIGYYQAWVDTGVFTITEILPNKLWFPTCPPSRTVSFTGSGDASANNDFANTGIICPLMWVDITTGYLRNCPSHDFYYYVNYCNNGTATANNTYIDISFTSDFNITGSTLPWTSQSGTTYRFDVGTVLPGQCGGFNISYQLDCDNQLGQTICVEARIFPDTVCMPVDTGWDKSSMKVEGTCEDSFARFVVYNHGSGNMTANSEYRIYINDVLTQTTPFKLNSGDSIVVTVLACGNTVRLEADQRPGHPGHSRPRAIIENCGSSCGQVVLNHVITVPEDDEDENVEMDCHEVRGSFDPNEKLVKPTGITSNRYISSKDEMEYQINFQNTGNDTAYIIAVRDTLPDYLDLSSLQSGASSHPYSLKIFGKNIIEWTFNNVNLVDSGTNEKESHGFVKFKVKQTANNPDGTVIENGAGIYFDNNPPVQTDKVTVTVNDSYILGLKEKFVIKNISIVEVFPNPFSNKAEFRIKNSELKIEKLELRIFDVLGQEKRKLSINNQQSTIINSEGLTSGMYFYKIYSEGNLIGTGKLVIQQ